MPRAVPDPLGGGGEAGRTGGRALLIARVVTLKVCELFVAGVEVDNLSAFFSATLGAAPCRQWGMYTGIGLLRSKLHPASRPVIR